MNPTQNFEATQFAIGARLLMRCKGHAPSWAEAAESEHGCGRLQSLTKAAVAVGSTADAWLGPDGRIIAEQFMASLKNRSLLDAAMVFALPIPFGVQRVQLLSGASAGVADEVAPKMATKLVLTNTEAGYTKVAGIVAMSAELVKSSSHEASKLFGDELKNAVVAASNTAFLAALTKTPATAGSTASESLAAGLAAVGDADAYIVAVSPAQARELALTRPTGSTLGVTGGEYLPGITVIPVAGLAKMTVIPASRLAIGDGGTVVRDSSQANVELDDSPVGGASAVVTSLWQHNLSAILVERSFKVVAAAQSVEVSL